MPILSSELQRNQTRRAILDASREGFVKHGYEGVSMRQIASELNCSPGTIYLYFQDKEELFQTLVEESFQRLFEELQKLPRTSRDPVEMIRRALHAYVDFGLRYPSDYAFAFLLRSDRPHRPHAAFEMLRFAVRRCVEEGRFRPLDVETASQGIWAAVHGVTALLIQRPRFPWVKKSKLIEHVIDTTLEGLQSAAAQPRGNGGGNGQANRK